MFLLFPKMKLWRNESLLMCGFERFLDEEMIQPDRDVLQFILLLTTPVQFWYSGTSKNRAWQSSFHGQLLWFWKLFLIRSTNVHGYPSTNSRTTSPLLLVCSKLNPPPLVIFYILKKSLHVLSFIQYRIFVV